MTSKNQSLKTITGTLYECITQCVPETALTSAELTTERRVNPNLRVQGFWTANFALYQMEDDEAVLYFGGRKANPIFNNIQKATKQLKNNDNYRPTEKDIAAVLESVKSGDTLRVELSELNLSSYTYRHPSSFGINPRMSAKLNSAQRALAERVYDSGNNFIKNMRMFAKADLYPKVYVLNPRYIYDCTEKSPIVRACKFDDYFNSFFFAYERSIDFDSGALRGVRS